MNSCRNYFILPVFSIFFLCCNPGSATEAANADSLTVSMPFTDDIPLSELQRYKNEIAHFYSQEFVAKGFNGALLVAKKGQIIFDDYRGYADLQTKDTLTSESSFHLASVSKTFTAMAILKLAEQGKLSTDDDLKEYFPAFPYDNVNIKMLLSHRSGLPNYVYFMQQLGWDETHFCSNVDILNYLIRFKPAATGKPGTHFNYSNTNYALLGLIIEKVSGKTYADFLRETFFIPLRMKNTYVFSMADSATAMPSFDWRGRPEHMTFLDLVFGDKNIYSTPEDLLRWDMALYSNKLFTQNTLEAAFTPYSNEKPGVRNYGYGWRMNVYPGGKKIVYHNGWWHGSNTVFIRMIGDSVTIIALGNKYNRAIYDAKKMATIFESAAIMDEEEKGGNNGEVLSADEKQDSAIADQTDSVSTGNKLAVPANEKNR